MLHICDHRGKAVKTMSKSPWFEDLDVVLTLGWNGCFGCVQVRKSVKKKS